ncbi:SDR family NAD(P)-dependent oxidoreductase [Streptococcus mutans]|uniref:SDR family NAD(P)-dependent oxidoreductase n=2 Tax=Streptococcus mutans TaxID=1309 RepID=UPI0021663880|nr:SDR family NAD(P)-dependent oxidoreductase [Streptococcus mutans]UVT95127.1 SDR family NAD(P)-dependent oxidoreductase [Streptococcus mutans]UVT96997.1 SDR family NAD(P)-dependent oxidoreductase [Streptococcus mutans]
MKYTELNKSDILSKIKNETISVEEGVALLKQQNKKKVNIKNTDVAVVGISAVVPGAKDIDEFWSNLQNGVDSVKETPKNRWKLAKDTVKNSRPICKWSGVLEDYDKFDPLFFNISPMEAYTMDPQQRLFLEESWKAIEDAGVNPEKLSGVKVGVFAGVAQGDYSQNLRHNKQKLDALTLNGGQNSILSARISYYLNLTGPSIAIDTACSSSLVATDMAYRSIVNGECEMALAGGVNILSTADMNLMTSNSKMLSSDGKCKTFDNNADGFVLSEAAAVVVLMSLKKAVSENYSIYGVIKGSGVNQDGKTNGITAPSAKSQKRLELEVYTKYGINPDKISLVEAHGTGTKLGDPIEVSALTDSFRKYTNRTKYCAIGSSKTNIGHCLTVAGTIGLIKVLLCLKHKKLVPSLHFNKLNEHIHLEGSPFYVNTEYKNWITKDGGKRLATVSSFGLSGTNCHMVIEESPYESKCSNHQEYQLFTLSAKTKDSLKRMIQQLLEWLNGKERIESLNNISYTLNVGRAHFEYRVAVIANEKKQLIKQFSDLLTDEGKIDKSIEVDEELISVPLDIDNVLKKLHEKVKSTERKVCLEKIKELYLDGKNIPWENIYEGEDCMRISLPTYVFMKERYWIDEIDNVNYISESVSMHPLLTSNESTFQDTRFKLSLTGNETVLRDHRIQGERVFPGAAYIEMIRAAAELSEKRKVYGIKNIIWLNPIKVKKDLLDIWIDLSKKDEDVVFEISTQERENVKIIHATGKISYETDDSSEDVVIEDLDEIKKKCDEEIANMESYYRLFESAFVNYGKCFRTIRKLWRSDNEVLARLEIEKTYYQESEAYVLYPGLLDGAFQSTIALGSLIDKENGVCNIPFKIEDIYIHDKIEKECYAHVKFSRDSCKEFGVKKYDINILNKYGRTLVELRGILSRPIKKQNNDNGIQTEKQGSLVAYKNVWKESTYKEKAFKNKSIVVFDIDKNNYLKLKQNMHSSNSIYLVMPAKECHQVDEYVYEINPNSENDYNRLRDSLLKKNMKSIYIINLWYNKKEFNLFDKKIESCVLQMHYLTKAFMEYLISNKIAIVNMVQKRGNDSCAKWNAINGYGKSVKIELPNLVMKSVMVDENTDLIKAIKKEFSLYDSGSAMFDVQYTDNRRMMKVMQEIPVEKLRQYDSMVKANSVYVISGGAGGLGLLFAEYISSKEISTICLLGRSALSEEKKSRIRKIKAKGSNVQYIQVDITDRSKLRTELNKIRSAYGEINGIIHSAGVIRDALIIKKTEDMILSVIQPKIKGVINLDELTKEDNLEFFVCFSAIASVFGNVGQCDYSYANSFLDYFMEERKSLVNRGKRKGTSVSINWPLWETGGMKIDNDTKKRLLQHLGMLALDSSDGFQFFEYLLNTQGGQFMIMNGINEAIRNNVKVVNNENRTQDISNENEDIESDFYEFRNRVEKYFINIISKVIKVSAERIKPEVDFDKYGIDSLIIININEELEKVFGKLSSSLLFEYSNIRKLCAYFMEDYREKLVELIRMNKKNSQSDEQNSEPDIRISKGRIDSIEYQESVDHNDDIAIIGISGKYPMAENIEEFWENLKQGKDCIEEIPKERWDYRKYFNPDKNNKGTTYSKWGGFIKDVDKFDPLFFNISPKEAELMDPQERLFLETVWNCLEGSGYPKDRLAGKDVGVFVGVMYGGYQLYGIDECNKGNMIALNSSFASIANRISYYFDLHGTSLSIDTMCSSTLTALHLACEDIQKGKNHMALVGGVNLILHPNKYLLLSQGKFISIDGRCKTFGEGGDGYVPSEGVGVILLKLLSEAERDGDQIYAVIKGTALNHGGKTNGYTVPNPNAQAKVIEKALKKTGIDPRTISYVEAHGTGTSLGDPIEITGLTKAYQLFTDSKQYCSIGSVKSNIGHSESAAGIAALTKVIMQMKNKTLVPSIHSDIINSKIDFKNSPFYIQHTTEKWNRPKVMIDGEHVEIPRRAAISSFGAGGTNAHAILEEYTKKDTKRDEVISDDPVIIIISARNEQRLKLYVKSISDWLENKKNTKEDNKFFFAEFKETLLREFAELLGVEDKQIDCAEKIKGYGAGKVEINHFIEKLNKIYSINIDPEMCSVEDSIDSITDYLWENRKKDIVIQLNDANQISEDEYRCTLSNIAYTLAVGREEMEERIAFLAESISELKQKLDEYNNGTYSKENIYHSNTKKKQPDTMIFDNKDSQEFLRTIVEEKNLSQIAKLWVQGAKFDWTKLFNETQSRIINVPTHPFVNKRYWIGSYNHGEIAEKESKEVIPTQTTERVDTELSQVPSEWLDNIKERVRLWEKKSESYDGDEVCLNIIEDAIAVVTLTDRENTNTFSDKLVMSLVNKFNKINTNPNIKAVIVTGYDNVFCMGGTQKQLIDISNQKSKFTDTPFMFLGLLQCNVPVISAIQGHASGGGLLFGLYGDIVVMSKEGVYNAVFTKYGFTPGMGATFILKEKLGGNLATEMMYTAKSFRGEELEERGASVIFRPQEEVLNSAIRIAKLIVDKPIHSLKILKKELATHIKEQLLKYIYKEEKMHDLTFNQPVVKERIMRYYKIGKTTENTKNKLTLKKMQGKTKQNNDVVVNQIMTVIQKILHLEEDSLDINMGFKDMGVDSISGLEIVREINKVFKLELDSIIIYDYPTIGELANYIEEIVNKEVLASLPKNLKADSHVWGIKKKSLSLKKDSKHNDNEIVDKKIETEYNSQSIVESVTNIAKEILHISQDKIETEIGFKDLGVDSISGLEIVREINKVFKLELDSIIIYDYPTIGELANYIAGLLDHEEIVIKDATQTQDKPKEKTHGVWEINKKGQQFVQKIQDRESIKQRIRSIVGKILNIPLDETIADSQFKELGVDSISGIEIIHDINRQFKIDLDTIIIYNYPTIEDLSEYIANNCNVLQLKTPVEKVKEEHNLVRTKMVLVKKESKKVVMEEKSPNKIGLKLKKKAIVQPEKKEGIDVKKTENNNSKERDGIAVIGMSGRFPGAKNLSEFWDNLCQGVCSISEIPKERWDNSKYYETDITVPNKTYCNRGGFLTGIDEFDPLFFNISPLEAEYMDPQQRIFLEESWKALENAGYAGDSLSNIKCGVFVGTTQGDYSKKMSEVNQNNTAEAFAGMSSSILAARISYFLNLKGPSISIDTACSSSLVAIHQACQSIINGESDMTLVGGIRIMLTPELFLQTSKMQMLSKSGVCRPFDRDADGTILSEGVGIIVLKSLQKAIEDGDYIYGVIKNSGVNQDGKTNGITAPSAQSQTDLELEVYKKGNIDPKDITFIETHGTGTKLGDPIEVKALTESFRKYTLKRQFCAIGSVKSNIGHTTMCAGVASMIKMLLCLQHKKIVPTVNFEISNNLINFKDSPFYVADKLQDWKVSENEKRIGAVSAFGMSGTNCHIVVEEAPKQEY